MNVTVRETNMGGFYIYQVYYLNQLVDTMSCNSWLTQADQLDMAYYYEEAIAACWPSRLTYAE